MRYTFFVLLALLFVAGAARGQALDVAFTVGDGTASQEVHVGLDPAATDGLDAGLGEAELPPFPPAGVFEARLVGTDIGMSLGQGTYRDYRTGAADFVGEQVHELKWQLGAGTVLSIGYALPEGVSARVQDFFGGAVLDETLTGTGTLEVTNSALTQAKITMVYAGSTTPTNTPPVFTSTAPTSAEVGAAYTYAAVATDADGDALTFTAPTLPAWLTLTDNGDGTATLEGTPTTAGTYDVVLRASDGTDAAEQAFTVVVTEDAGTGAAVDLVFTVGDGDASQEVRLGLDPAATDGLDADLGEAELPPFPPSGVFEARLVGTDIGVSLGQGTYRDYRTGAADFVGEQVHELKWQLGSGTVLSVGYNLPEGITVQVQDFFGGAVIDETLVGAGTLEVTNAALTQVKLTVVYSAAVEENTAPAFTSTALTTGEVGAAYTYTAVATDADGDALTLTAPTLPAWLTFADGGDGTATLEGTPTAAGTYDVVLRASDGTDAAEQAFAVVVTEDAGASAAVDLVFTVGDGDASQEVRLGLDPAATDGLDADLGEAELPPFPPSGVFEARFVGASVPAELGQGSYRDYRAGAADFVGEVEHQLQWQLGAGTVLSLGYNLPEGITVRVQDFFGGAVIDETLAGTGTLDITNSALTQVKLTVAYTVPGEENTAPAFTSTAPTTAETGAAYSYAVVATDADGDAITLTAPTLPAWLTFADGGDGSGTLSGTPTAAGTYDVVLRASDGTDAAEQAFTVTVTDAPTAAALDLVFTVGDGDASQEVRLGLDPAATDGLDAELGEAELPPFPPSGVFEARFVGASVPAELGQGSYRDYRTGPAGFVGEVEHQLQWQLGDGAVLSLGYDLPPRVSVRVQDFFGGAVIDETLAGAGTLEITNTALTQVKLTVVYSSGVGTEDDPLGGLTAFALHAPYPNPARADAQVAVDVPSATRLRVDVYDARGRHVGVLVDQDVAPGTYRYRWDAGRLASGVYFVRMRAGDVAQTQRVTLVR